MLSEYVEMGNSAFDCPGHQGGQYFRKHPAGRYLYDFYGENIFRSDICNADVKLGDLLIHEGAACDAQKHAAQVFNADKTYFVLNGTSSANKLGEITTIKAEDPPNTNNIVSHSIVNDTNTYLNAPLITILVTTFNSQKSIKNTLNSLFNQSYPNIEIIVIDDHSQDNTMNILQAYTKQYKNIKIISLKENVGTYVAKNIGLKYSSGEFITCQDSDDWAHPQKLALQVAPLLQHKELIVTFSKWVRLDPIGNPYARTIYPLMRLNPSSALFRKKEVCEKTALWDWVRIGADSEFNARLKLIFGHKGYYTVNKPLTFGAHRENSLMTAQSTGYVNGVSLPREAYWKAWNIWHISQLQRGHAPLLSSSPKREFFQYDQHPIMDVISYAIIN